MENKQHEEFLVNELLDDKIPPKKKKKAEVSASSLSYHEKRTSPTPTGTLRLGWSTSVSGCARTPGGGGYEDMRI